MLFHTFVPTGVGPVNSWGIFFGRNKKRLMFLKIEGGGGLDSVCMLVKKMKLF